MKNDFHAGFYSFAKYYDIAFDFKDVSSECDFFEEMLKKHKPKLNLKSIVEFAAGPALHSIEMAKRGWAATAVDLSPEMQVYGLQKAAQQGVHINYLCQDMIHFQSTEKHTLAVILMDSTSYLLTNDDVIRHLESVAKVLDQDGIYLLEMSHPKSVFNVAKTTINEWESKRDGCKVKLRWGSEEDIFNPMTQVTETSVVLEFDDHGKRGIIKEKSPQRCFTATEFEALVRASGVFEIVEVFGALKKSISFDNQNSAWRMVPILKRK